MDRGPGGENLLGRRAFLLERDAGRPERMLEFECGGRRRAADAGVGTT
jgi:hypothetical protein